MASITQGLTFIERFEVLKASIKARPQVGTQERTVKNCNTSAKMHTNQLMLANKDLSPRSVKQKLEQALLDKGFKDKDAANLQMQVSKQATYKDICTHAASASTGLCLTKRSCLLHKGMIPSAVAKSAYSLR